MADRMKRLIVDVPLDLYARLAAVAHGRAETGQDIARRALDREISRCERRDGPFPRKDRLPQGRPRKERG